jgi:hypothetical protein
MEALLQYQIIKHKRIPVLLHKLNKNEALTVREEAAYAQAVTMSMETRKDPKGPLLAYPALQTKILLHNLDRALMTYNSWL